MDDHDDLGPIFDWGLLSDALGAASLGVLFLAALALIVVRVVIIAVLAAAPTHQSAKFVFTTFIDNTGLDGVGWSQRAGGAYVVVIGILTAQYSLSGKIMDAIR